MASKLIEEPFILETLRGKRVSVMLIMPTVEACNLMRPLYITVQVDGQIVSRVLVDNEDTLNVLLVSMLSKIGKKSDIPPTDLIRIKFCRTTT